MMAKVEHNPLTETLEEWSIRYSLTQPEREVLFAHATGIDPSDFFGARVERLIEERESASQVLAAPLSVEPEGVRAMAVSEAKAQMRAVAEKTEAPTFKDATIRLLRQALDLASFDKERREGKSGGSEDDDGQ